MLLHFFQEYLNMMQDFASAFSSRTQWMSYVLLFIFSIYICFILSHLLCHLTTLTIRIPIQNFQIFSAILFLRVTLLCFFVFVVVNGGDLTSPLSSSALWEQVFSLTCLSECSYYKMRSINIPFLTVIQLLFLFHLHSIFFESIWSFLPLLSELAICVVSLSDMSYWVCLSVLIFLYNQFEWWNIRIYNVLDCWSKRIQHCISSQLLDEILDEILNWFKFHPTHHRAPCWLKCWDRFPGLYPHHMV